MRNIYIGLPMDVAKALLGAIRAEMMGFEADCLDPHAIEYFDKLMKGGTELLEAIAREEAKMEAEQF